MALVNYGTKEITFKLVYYGTGLGGKTTNLKVIHSQLSPQTRGELVSLATETERTLFFDFNRFIAFYYLFIDLSNQIFSIDFYSISIIYLFVFSE